MDGRLLAESGRSGGSGMGERSSDEDSDKDGGTLSTYLERMTLIPTESPGCRISKTGWEKGRWVVWESVDEGIVVLDSTKRWGYVSGDPVAETKSDQAWLRNGIGRGMGRRRTMIPK